MKFFNLLKKNIIYLVKYLVKQKWFLFGVLPGVIVIGLAFVLLAGHFLMTYSGTCLHCHVSQTRFEKWTHWNLPSRVTCVNCHSETGQILPHKYSASAEFVNKNCMHCHGDIEKKGKEDSYDIKINHSIHIQELELKCVDCHMTVVHEAMIKGMNRPTHAVCIECHEEVEKGESESCELCHI